MFKGKRIKECKKNVDPNKSYSIEEAVSILKKSPSVGFDETVDVSFVLALDTRKSDQQVRDTILLPRGSGKKAVILVFAKGEQAEEALKAGADFVGDNDLSAKVLGGWVGFTNVVATPEMMRTVGALGKVLGPRGLMPSPKLGTVTQNVGKIIEDIKMGRLDIKSDKDGNLNTFVGKKSFPSEDLVVNFKALLGLVKKSKPSGGKGDFVKRVFISSSMGPGIRLVV